MKASNNVLGEPVYEYLRNSILNMEFKPGEKLSESSVAEKFGVSRTPIREAMRRLENEGLLNIYPNRFAEVVKFSDEDIANLGIVRLSLDVTAIQLAIFYGSNADFLNLQKIAEECYEAAKAGDRSRRIKLDSAFHLEISRISKNSTIEKYQSQVLLQIELVQATKYKDSTNAADQTKMHFDIVDAMFERNEKLALELIRSHIIDFYKLNEYFPFLNK